MQDRVRSYKKRLVVSADPKSKKKSRPERFNIARVGHRGWQGHQADRARTQAGVRTVLRLTAIRKRRPTMLIQLAFLWLRGLR